MTTKNINIFEVTASTPIEELKLQFFQEIIGFTIDQWLAVCLRFEEDEDNIINSGRKILKIGLSNRDLLFKDDEEFEHGVEFNKLMAEKLIQYFLKLPEAIDYNGHPYLLRSTANEATESAKIRFIVLNINFPFKDKQKLFVPGLRPFHGLVTLPPSFDYKKKSSKSPPKNVPKSIKFSDVASESDFVFHIAFPDKYFTYEEKAPEWVKIPPRSFYIKNMKHVTWNFDRFIDLECSFGGESKDKCAVCGGALSHLITLPSVKGLPYSDLKQLTISTCMKCVGWVGEPIFFKHDNDGKPRPCPIKEGFEEGEGDEGVIKPATVYLSQTTPKFYNQSWGSSDDQNLHRIGGKPSWVQGKYNFKCPECKKSMAFLMQLDSDLPTVDGQRWLWGSGGVLFIFWCDDCKIDGQMWQCT